MIQLHEKTDKYSYKRTRLFSGQGIKVKQTEFEVTKEVDLKSGYSYSYDIIAVDKKGETISITDIKHREYDFEIID